MEVQRTLHMNTGNGETSYAKNSTVQSSIISIAKPVTVEAMEELLSRSLPEIMGIADLGCSSGPNTLNVVSEIIDVVYEKYRRDGRTLPELNVFLNDLYNNDFNQVFELLPTFRRKLKTEKDDEFARKCSIFGAPGSFYGKLFSGKSIHFVHSSSSLHWLSQKYKGLILVHVPPCLDKEAKEAMNKGEIYISKKSPARVLEAYVDQFHEDFSVFLKSRSEEVVEGGGMVLSFMGRKSMDPTRDESYRHWELIGQALMGLVSEGLIEEEKVDCFNLPYYAPCKEELEVEIEREGSFILGRFEAFEIDWDGESHEGPMDAWAARSSGRRVAKTLQAVTESMFESDFGGEIMAKLFTRIEEIVTDHLWKNRANYINLVISLVRK